MAKKPHIKLDTTRQSDGVIRLRFNYGPPDAEDENDSVEEPNYLPMANAFRGYLNRFRQDLNARAEERNPQIFVPENIDYIQILFQDQFSLQTATDNHYQNWYNDYGLMGVNFSQFNCQVLFAIIDRVKFRTFLSDISNFILKETNEDPRVTYSARVKYIKEFKLLTTNDILQFQGGTDLLNFRLMDFPLEEVSKNRILEGLINYLRERNLSYNLVEETQKLEISGSTPEQAREIAANFDIVLSVTSSLTTVIRPSEFNLEERGYGFTIVNADDENLPVIGILDTGISNTTPLASIIINDTSFNLTDGSPFQDNVFRGEGHGTAVGALAALGRKPYLDGYRGNYQADARLLSMKIMDTNSAYLSEAGVVNMLRTAKAQYPDVKIFVLTTCYSVHKAINEDYSTYAYELDKFAHDTNSLIFICTGNNHDASNHNNNYDLAYFNRDETNLCTPAESLNNVIVGGAADALQIGIFRGISSSKEYPTIFTRKSHIDIAKVLKRKKNRNYFRPDVIECAGDYEQGQGFIGTGTNATMSVLSADRTRSFTKDVGTSFSAPLAANIAAQIQKLYPTLRAQSMKALIVNSASLDKILFTDPLKTLKNKTSGHGLVEPVKSVFSNENSITFLVEETIRPEQVMVIPINFPIYLAQGDLGKRRGLLKIRATLCFSFQPILNNQLGYCPVHIAFNFYRNQSGDDILRSEDDIKSKLRTTMSWTQDARHKAKPVPYFNTHKVSFQAGHDDFVSEDNTFKLAVSCRINPQLLAGQEARYNIDHPFSIAITIEENLRKPTGALYDEMEAINLSEVIAVVEDLEGEGEAG